MPTTIQLEFNDVTVDGLPTIDDTNTSVIFLWDGNVMSGWPLSNAPPGTPIQDYGEIRWEGSEFPPQLVGVRYWAYMPQDLYRLSLGLPVEADNG